MCLIRDVRQRFEASYGCHMQSMTWEMTRLVAAMAAASVYMHRSRVDGTIGRASHVGHSHRTSSRADGTSHKGLTLDARRTEGTDCVSELTSLA
jgi:hypothetical protein